MYTTEGLVKHAQAALKLPTKYMWAGMLRPITDQYITSTVAWVQKCGVPASTSGYTEARIKDLRGAVGKAYYGVDCVNLIKSYYWSGKPDGGVGSPKYDSKTDVNSNVMFQKAKVAGKIGAIPEVPGLIVYSKSHPHVGIYIGNGYTIESTLGARGDGVVKRKLDNFWEYYFECPFITYKHDTIMTETTTKEVVLEYPAIVRSKPTRESTQLRRYEAGAKVRIVKGAEVTDKTTGYKYVRLAGDSSRWIVKTSIKGT